MVREQIVEVIHNIGLVVIQMVEVASKLILVEDKLVRMWLSSIETVIRVVIGLICI